MKIKNSKNIPTFFQFFFHHKIFFFRHADHSLGNNKGIVPIRNTDGDIYCLTDRSLREPSGRLQSQVDELNGDARNLNTI